jgi:hypothetical protein
MLLLKLFIFLILFKNLYEYLKNDTSFLHFTFYLLIDHIKIVIIGGLLIGLACFISMDMIETIFNNRDKFMSIGLYYSNKITTVLCALTMIELLEYNNNIQNDTSLQTK